MIYDKLLKIQTELKAPKGQFNSFGKYNYRSCEDILEALKPLTSTHNCVLNVSDQLVYVGNRFYIESSATLTDIEDNSFITNKAYAREEEVKKGMDGSQITGTASSYARKYALNGLFCIDDTKDADTDEFTKNDQKKDTEPPKNEDAERQKRIEEKTNTLAIARKCNKKTVTDAVNNACGDNKTDVAREAVLDAYLLKLKSANNG